MKTLKLFVGFLAAASSFVITPYSQDYPPSVGSPSPPPAFQSTYCRHGLNLWIPTFGILRDSITAALGNACTVTDVNVRIDTVLHTWVRDLRFYIQHLGIGVRIINQVGGSGDNFIGTILNDSALIPIASGTAPFTGSYIPSSPLVPFNNTLTDGVWRLLITDTAGADTGFLRAWCVVISYTCPVGGIHTIEIPNYYSLSQNYPNPFNPNTTIKFGIPKGENVKLIVYDMLGREVATLVNEFRNPGTYEVDFDASALAGGVYFYTLIVGKNTNNGVSFTQTRKMLLLK